RQAAGKWPDIQTITKRFGIGFDPRGDECKPAHHTMEGSSQQRACDDRRARHI
ncbi:hypothetical protein BC831DRAFT_484197, partial [Entophlyctis helioformis]